jgi:transposase-like protein
MKRENRYGVRSLERDFPTEETCLNFLFDAQHSRQCSCGGHYSKVSGRKQYQCSKCRFQIAPLSGTIFHKSDTPLTLWFKAILAFSNAKSSISAKQLERDLEVTYKTAWRMLMLIRLALIQKPRKLRGVVEIDTTFLGGYRPRKKGEQDDKTVVIAALQRGGDVRASVIPDAGAHSHSVFLHQTVQVKSHLMSDKTHSLKHRTKHYDHYTVNHSKGEYVRGPVHVNSVEGFFAHVKRSIKGVHKTISKKHSQAYLNGFVFHWNNGHSDKERFGLLLGSLLQPSK